MPFQEAVIAGPEFSARVEPSGKYAFTLELEGRPRLRTGRAGCAAFSELSALPKSFRRRFNIDVRVNSEVTAIHPDSKTVTVRRLEDGSEYTESYDKLILSPGARAVRPQVPGIDDPDDRRINGCVFHCATDTSRAPLRDQNVLTDPRPDHIDRDHARLCLHTLDRFYDHKLIPDKGITLTGRNNAPDYLSDDHCHLLFRFKLCARYRPS